MDERKNFWALGSLPYYIVVGVSVKVFRGGLRQGKDIGDTPKSRRQLRAMLMKEFILLRARREAPNMDVKSPLEVPFDIPEIVTWYCYSMIEAAVAEG